MDSQNIGIMTLVDMPKKSKLKLPPLELTTTETFGQRLARIRKERGYTQVELATKIGIIQGLITNYECERLRMHSEMLTRFAKALGVSSDELLGLASNKKTNKLSLKIVRRLQKIEHLPTTKQKALLQTIDGFLQGAGIGA